MAYLLSLLMLLSLPAAAQELSSQQVEKYIGLYYRAESALRDFDRELETEASPGFLERSKSYRELIALRHLLEGIEREFSREVKKLSKTLGPKKGRAAMKALKKKFIAASATDKIALYDLVENSRSLNVKIFSSHADLLAHREKYKAEINTRVEAARKSDRFESEIRAMVSDLGIENLDDSAAPSAIRPSPGSDGNLNGSNFPTNTWALTYDDGPSGKNTLPILEHLQKYSIKATFFWLAANLDGNLAVVEKVKEAGMPLANHSFTHANLPKVNAEALQKEITDSTTYGEEIFGERPTFFRCPYGAGLNVARIRQLIADNGMVHVFWNVDSLDWKDKNPASIHARVKKQMLAQKQGVILFHDIHTQTIEASKLLFEYSKSLEGKPEALRWVTMPEIVNELNAPRIPR